LAEVLATNGVKPVGFAVVGTDRPGRFDYSYYGSGQASREDTRENGSGAGGLTVPAPGESGLSDSDRR
jgi:hypothetical protein